MGKNEKAMNVANKGEKDRVQGLTLTKYLPYLRCFPNCFRSILAFFHYKSLRRLVVLFPFYTSENRDVEKLSDVLRVMEWVVDCGFELLN